LTEAIHRAIHPGPNNRFASARQFRTALRTSRYRGRSLRWDILTVVLHLLWGIVRWSWRALARALYRAARRPRQAIIEALMLCALDWRAWVYGTALWRHYRPYIVLGACVIGMLIVVRLLGRRRRWW